MHEGRSTWALRGGQQLLLAQRTELKPEVRPDLCPLARLC